MKNILSLFDGISCARVALDASGVLYENYYASEIDKYAISIAEKNYPDTIQIGNVKDIKSDTLHDIDLLIGGSPCQDLSIAKASRKGLDGERSSLFYEYLRILNELKPRFFILENVASMSKESKDIITNELFGIEPIMINASHFSAQNRKRYFWVGKFEDGEYKKVEIDQPIGCGSVVGDILEENVDEKYFINISDRYGLKGLVESNEKAKTMTASMYKGYGNDGVSIIRVGQIGNGGQGERIYSTKGKSVSLCASGGGMGAKTGIYKVDDRFRKLTPIECERLQGLPDNYTEGVSNTQRYKAIGNAFNVDVVSYILKSLYL